MARRLHAGWGYATAPIRLREARIAVGLTQEQLGFVLNVTKSSVSAWENAREAPSFRLLPKLGQTLGCSLDNLICGDEVVTALANGAADPHRTQSPDEALLLQCYRAISKSRRRALLTLLSP